MGSVIESTNPVVKAIVEATAPRPAIVAASRGLLPLPQTDLLELLVALADSSDPELKENAISTLRAQEMDTLGSAVRSTSVASSVLSYFAAQNTVPASIHEGIVTNDRTPAAAIGHIARR